MILRKFSFWFLMTAIILALAGFVAAVNLQRAVDAVKDRQTTECQAVASLQRSITRILTAEVADPNTSALLRGVIQAQEPVLQRALAASHHC